MKKLKLITLFLTLCLSLCSCNSNDTNSGTQDTADVSDVSETEIETTEIETTETPEENSVWSLQEYVNEFDVSTGKKYLRGDAIGTFCNSVTTDSDLRAAILVDKGSTLTYDRRIDYNYDRVSIMLWEYGDNKVQNPYKEARFYNVRILINNVTPIDFLGCCYSNSDRVEVGDARKWDFSEDEWSFWWENDDLIFLNHFDGYRIIDLLEGTHNNNTLKIYIEDKERPTTNYLFEIDTTGFKELYDETFNSDN